MELVELLFAGQIPGLNYISLALVYHLDFIDFCKQKLVRCWLVIEFAFQVINLALLF